MTEWGIDELISKGGVMIMDGKKDITKREQLRVVFRTILTKFGKDYYNFETGQDRTHTVKGSLLNEYIDILLKEVSIRTPLK